jgi:hypothetical protein
MLRQVLFAESECDLTPAFLSVRSHGCAARPDRTVNTFPSMSFLRRQESSFFVVQVSLRPAYSVAGVEYSCPIITIQLI